MMKVTSIIHTVTGFITGFFINTHPTFSIMLLILFILYELSEWVIVRDRLFPEIKEYSIGYVAGFLVSLILWYLINYIK